MCSCALDRYCRRHCGTTAAQFYDWQMLAYVDTNEMPVNPTL